MMGEELVDKYTSFFIPKSDAEVCSIIFARDSKPGLSARYLHW